MPSPTASTVVHSAVRSTRRASTALRRDDILTLIRECDALLTIEPMCLHTRAVRGHAYMKAKLWDRAVADFTAILYARSDDVHARFSRGMALFKDGRVDPAHADFSCVLDLNPHHVMARYARAGCYNTEGKFHHAIEEYTIALQHDEMENELTHGVRSGKLSRGWHHDGGSIAMAKTSDEDCVREQQRAHERRATVDAVARSPQRRCGQIDARCDSVPIFTAPQRASEAVVPTTQQATVTTTSGKRPRKVVQVRLNLSDFVAVPTTAPQVPAAHIFPHTSVSTPSGTSRGADGKAPALLSPPAPPEIGATAVDLMTLQPLASTSPPFHSTQVPHGDEACGTMAVRASASSESHAPRRAVRRVTIAL